MTPPWWQTLYDQQHQVWPAWSQSDADAPQMADFLHHWLGLKAPCRILDLGCGVGRELVALAQLGHQTVGVEFSPTLAQQALQRAVDKNCQHHVTVYPSDFRTIDFEPDQFDVLYCWDSTLNIFSPAEGREILHRSLPWLKPGGWLVLAQLRLEYWRSLKKTFRWRDDTLGPGTTHRTYYYDEHQHRLIDQVTHVDDHTGQRQELPAQRLHLYTEQELLELMEHLGLQHVALHHASSAGWDVQHAINDNAHAVCGRGQKK